MIAAVAASASSSGAPASEEAADPLNYSPQRVRGLSISGLRSEKGGSFELDREIPSASGNQTITVSSS